MQFRHIYQNNVRQITSNFKILLQYLNQMFAINISNRQIKNFNLEQINGIYETQLSYQKTKSIDCSSNLLQSTDGFSKFQQLFSLDLSHNRINQIFQMTNTLVELNLAHNRLGALFNDFQKTLRTQGTRLYAGSFLSNLKALRSIDLSYNEISVITSNVFEGNPELRNINLSNNSIKGALWCFNKLENLQSIDIGYNQFQLSDLKPLEKIHVAFLELRFNPLENNDNVDERLLKQLQFVQKIHLSYGTLENQLDHSSESAKGLYTSRSTVSAKKRNKTPLHPLQSQAQNKTPVKKTKEHTPQKQGFQARTPTKQIAKSPSLSRIATTQNILKTDQDQKSTVKVPPLNLESSKVKPFIIDDAPLLTELDTDDLTNELHQLGQLLREKRQHQVNVERQVMLIKNQINLIKLMLRGVYLYDVNQQPPGFEDVMQKLELELQQAQPNVQDLKVQLLTFNEKHGELGQMWSQLSESERLVETMKQLL